MRTLSYAHPSAYCERLGSARQKGRPRRYRTPRRAYPGIAPVRPRIAPGDREAADDLVQDSLERALSRWQQRRRGDLRGWIYTILYHRFITDRYRLRRSGGENKSLSDIQEADQPGAEGGQDEALAHRDLVRGLATLPEEQRAVLLLVGVEDFSYEQAARILEVPIGTVMSRLSRGRERLRRYMNGDRIPVRQRAVTAPESVSQEA